VAIVHRGVDLTWRSFAAHVLAVMEDLRALGLKAGQTLGIEVDDRYLHLLLILAGEALGLTTISLDVAQIGPPDDLGRLCDRIAVSRTLVAHMDKTWLITPEWAVRVLTRDPGDLGLERLERDQPLNAVLRLMTTSGTTGRPKVMGMSRALLQAHIRVLLLPMATAIAAHPVFLCLYRYTVRGAHTRTMLTLRLGGSVHFTGRDVVWELMAGGTGNYLFLVSGDLERIVRSAPEGVGPLDVHIDVTGGAVPDALRAETFRKVSTQLVTTYAANETHSVTRIGEGGVGRLLPGAQVRIVDDAGEPVGLGETGHIRVKTTTMIDGYVDAPELDRTAFVDGWYRTRDIGYQPDSETLVVIGRADDMLNIGGVKIMPGPIEVCLRGVEGVRDALVTDLDDQLATREALVAIELEAGVDEASVRQRIDPIVRSSLGFYRWLALPALPRTESGKIKREAVRDLFRRPMRDE
jgi:acyl-coenzyme A synthetase/AMP-(fatty) acid ligase